MLWKTRSRLMRQIFRLVFLTTLAMSLCSGGAAAGESASSSRNSFPGKKILWVDSYHQAYEWSAGIEAGIRRELQDSGVELRIVRMDSKRRPSEAQIRGAALRAKAEIDSFRPDLVIASDDNAVKYLVVPYLKDTDLPVVFCGVNWEASQYGLPAGNVTGMVEVDLVEALAEHLNRYAKGRRVGSLSGDLYTAQKVASYINDHYYAGQMTLYRVRSFAEFKEAFLLAQNEVDILFFHNYAAIEDWDPVAAERYIVEHIKVPTGGFVPYMAPFVQVVLAKDANEQGEWAADTALEILGGRSPAEIPLAQNERGRLIVNLKMAKALDVTFPVDTLKAATVIGQEAYTKNSY
jgi:ABC transporter substrate binding protein